jgi:hypothetical protein
VPQDKTGKTTIQVDRRVGDLVRRLAGYEGLSMTDMLERMLRQYLSAVRPQLDLGWEYDETGKVVSGTGAPMT